MLSTYVTSVIRTIVPTIVGFLLSIPGATWLVHGFGVTDPQARQAIAAALTFGISFLYYAIVRVAENKWPQTGALLGVPTPPVYTSTPSGPTTGGSANGTTPKVEGVTRTSSDSTVAAPSPSSAALPGNQPAVAHGVSFSIPVSDSMPGLVIKVSTETSPTTGPAVSLLPTQIGVNGSVLKG
jgi:hypothetical protein